MVRKKAFDPRTMPCHLTTLTGKMYKHLHTPELIPIV